MQTQSSTSEIWFLRAKDILDEIANCDKNIRLLIGAGNGENSSIIRQEKHLKHQFCLQFNQLLSERNLNVHLVEEEYTKLAA
jgi:hypothetical protein